MKARINGKTYELPKLTMAVNEKLEDYDEKETAFKNEEIKASDLYREQYKLINDLLGETAVCEILQGDNIEEIDLTNLTLALMDIRKAYTDPITEKHLEDFRGTMGKIKGDIELVKEMKNV